MKDRDGWNLRGPVHTCRIQRTWYTRQCGADACETEERGDSAELEFLLDGSVLSHHHRNHDGSEWNTTNEYSDAELLIASRSGSGSGEIHLQSHSYDEAGRLVSVTGNFRTETYEYDAGGRKTKTLRFDATAPRTIVPNGWGVEGTDSIYGAQGATVLTTVYNEREQPAELLFSDGAGRQLSRVRFEYDHDGRLVEESQIHTDGPVPHALLASLPPEQIEAVLAIFGAEGEVVRRSHRYDQQGRRVQTRTRMGQLSEERKTRVFNEHGDQIEEVSEDQRRDFNMEDGQLQAPHERVSRSEVRFSYEYDANGNWTKRTVAGRGGGDQEFTVSTVELRGIEYFV